MHEHGSHPRKKPNRHCRWWALAFALWTVCLSPTVCVAADLPDELRDRQVADAFIPIDGKPVGILVSLNGGVIIDHADAAGAYRAAKGDALYAGDVVYTLADGRCRLRFVTEDLITMGGNGRIRIDQVLDHRQEKQKRSRFSMLRGKAMFFVMRLLRYRQIEAKVVTPTAICGVRGTKFGVEIVASQVEIPETSTGTPPPPPPPPRTVVLGFEGTVAVTASADGTTAQVGAGQQLDVSLQGAGIVVTAPAGAAAAFLQDVSVNDGGSDGGQQQEAPQSENTSGAPLPLTTPSPVQVAQALQAPEKEISDFQSDESTQVIQESIIPGNKYGYFSALLTRYFGAAALADIYTKNTRTNFDGSSVSGASIVDSNGFISAFGTQSNLETTPYVKQIKTVAGGPADSGDLGTTRQMDNADNTAGWPIEDNLGKNEYMEWGFWRMSKWVQPGGAGTASFAVTDRAYHISGLPTSDAAAAGIVGTYGGAAYGTYWSGTGGTDMVGGFSCDINVPARSVSNFNLNVAGGGKSAAIAGGTGGFINSSGEFTVSGGTWTLTAGTVTTYKSLTGSLFGPAGEYIGGSWAMDLGSGNNAAVGIFAGSKNGTPTTPSTPATIPGPPSPPP